MADTPGRKNGAEVLENVVQTVTAVGPAGHLACRFYRRHRRPACPNRLEACCYKNGFHPKMHPAGAFLLFQDPACPDMNQRPEGPRPKRASVF